MFKPNRVLGGALLAFALISGQVAHAEETPVNLLVKLKSGRVTYSKTTIKTNVANMDVILSQSMKETVKEVKENGDVTVEAADQGSSANVGGQEMEQPAMPPRTITLDKFGKLKEAKDQDAGGPMSPEIAKLMTSLSNPILTEKAVKANDTWETEVDNPAVKEKKVKVKDTYLGIEKVEGKDYWKIKQTAEAVVDADGAKMTYEFTAWINPETGETVKREGTVKDVPTMYGVLTMEVVSKSVKPDEKDKKPAAKP